MTSRMLETGTVTDRCQSDFPTGAVVHTPAGSGRMPAKQHIHIRENSGVEWGAPA